MKKRKKLLILFLALTMIITSFPMMSFASDEKAIDTEQKIFSKATLDDDFSNSDILVVMKRNSSKLNKAFSKSAFSEVNALEIEDLTQIDTKKVDTEEYLEEVDFHQILKITLKTNNKEDVLKAIKKLEEREDVLSAEPNYISALDTVDIQPALNAYSLFSLNALATNDPYLNNQWGHGNINLFEAWNNWTDDAYHVRVGIMDDGIMNHPDLIANVTTGYNAVSGNAETYTSGSAQHGTRVASVVGAVGNNGIGIAGVAPKVSLVSINVYATGSHENYDADFVRGVTYANNNYIDIINYSSGEATYSSARYNAIKNYPGLFVCSAGNDSQNNNGYPHYPSNFILDHLISVAAIDSNNQLTWFSNYGSTSVSIAAPGTNIYITYKNISGIYDYGPDDGTSLAAPYVTGVAALIKSYYPDLTPKQIKSCIINGADPVSALNGKCVANGKLNAYKALQQASQLYYVDLEVTNVYPHQNSLPLLEGKNISFIVEVKNSGSKAISETAPITIKTTIGSDIVSFTSAGYKIHPGQTVMYGFTYKPPVFGKHTVKTIVSSKYLETNTSNNTFTNSITVG